MKRLCVVMGCIFLLTACGKKADEANGANNPSEPTTLGVQDAATTSDKPAVKTIYGEISEVAGNSITIKLMEQNNMNAGGQIMQRGEMPASGSIDLPDGTTMTWDENNPPDFSKMRESMGSATSGDGTDRTMQFRTSDGTGDGAVVMEGVTTSGADTASGEAVTATGGGTDRGNRGMKIARAYTGEEIEFIIPVGVPIMTMSRGENGMEETELALTKLKPQSTITITYKEDEKTIDKILVIPATSGGGPGGGPDMNNLPANAQVTDFGDGRVMVTIPKE